jgi:hypothetical protein
MQPVAKNPRKEQLKVPHNLGTQANKQTHKEEAPSRRRLSVLPNLHACQ